MPRRQPHSNSKTRFSKKTLPISARPPPTPVTRRKRLKQLAQAQAQIAALLSDKEILHLEKVALEDRSETCFRHRPRANKGPAQSRPEDLQKSKAWNMSGTDLQKRLEQANKELANKGNKNVASKVLELESQMV